MHQPANKARRLRKNGGLIVPRTAQFPNEETVYQSECVCECVCVREGARRKLRIHRTENKNMRRLSALLMVTAYMLAGYDLDIMFSLHTSMSQQAITLKIVSLSLI